MDERGWENPPPPSVRKGEVVKLCVTHCALPRPVIVACKRTHFCAPFCKMSFSGTFYALKSILTLEAEQAVVIAFPSGTQWTLMKGHRQYLQQLFKSFPSASRVDFASWKNKAIKKERKTIKNKESLFVETMFKDAISRFLSLLIVGSPPSRSVFSSVK